MNRIIFVMLATLLLAGCGGAKKAAGPPPPSVTITKALQKEVTEWDDYTGRLAAVEEVEVRAQVSGYLESIHFKDGQIVKKGDLLFIIDPRPYQAVLDRAQAQAKQADAGLALADLNLKRTQELATKNAVASQDLDDQRSKQLQAAAAVQVAQAEVNSAKLNLDFTQITAPVSGRINRHLVSEGNLISGGASNASLLTTIRAAVSAGAVFPVTCEHAVAGRAPNRKHNDIEWKARWIRKCAAKRATKEKFSRKTAAILRANHPFMTSNFRRGVSPGGLHGSKVVAAEPERALKSKRFLANSAGGRLLEPKHPGKREARVAETQSPRYCCRYS